MTITQQQIIALAVEAGAIPASDGEYFPSELVICESMFEAFAMAAYQRGVRDEREACAKMCQENDVEIYRRKYRLCEPASDDCMHHGQAYANAIRARSDK